MPSLATSWKDVSRQLVAKHERTGQFANWHAKVYPHMEDNNAFVSQKGLNDDLGILMDFITTEFPVLPL